MKKKLIAGLVVLSAFTAFAAPGDKTTPAKWGGGANQEERADRLEQRENQVRLMYVVAISEALGLNEADAMKMSERMKGFEEKRRPLRQSMGEAMRGLKAASDGDQAALAQVDANVAKVLDGRAQMAQLDKELFTTLAQGQPADKRAKLALTLARLNHDMKGFKKQGRHHGEHHKQNQ